MVYNLWYIMYGISSVYKNLWYMYIMYGIYFQYINILDPHYF